MTDEIMQRLAVLENQVRECLPTLDKVAAMERDMFHFGQSLDEVKKVQQEGIKERQEQYENLSAMIRQHHTIAIQKIHDTFTPVSDGLNEINTTIKTTMRTLFTVFGCIGAIITIVVSIIAVWPQ